MTEVLLLTLGQFGVLFFFIIAGYLLKRFNIVGDVRAVSALLMWVFIPALVFRVFYRSFTPDKLAAALPYALAGLILLVLTAAVFYPVVRRYKDRIERNTFYYSMIVSNMSYVGIPLVEGVFPEFTLYFMVFIIAYQLFVFTVGAEMFREKRGFTLKGLASPIIIALVLGIVAGLAFGATGTKLPSFIEQIIDGAAGCMSPVAMLITGMTLARLPLKSALSRKDVYFFTFLRLVAIPVVFGGLAVLLQRLIGFDRGIAVIVIIYSALPMGINSVVFAEANDGDGTLGARCALVSHAFSIITLPCVFALLTLI